MSPFLARRRALLAVTLSTAALLALCLGAYVAFGDALVRAGYEGRSSLGALNRLLHQEAPFERVRAEAHEHFVGFLTLVVAGFVLFVLLDGALRARRRLLWTPIALVAWWLALETLAAPLLVRTFTLSSYVLIRDVDHRPPPHAERDFNSDGLRGTSEPETFRPEDLNLLFLGDSFTYGYRVAAQQAFPLRTASLLTRAHPEWRLHAANFGWISASPFLALRRLAEIGERYHPDVVVLCVDMTDFHDDIRYRNMLERRGLYRLYPRMPLALKLFETLAPGLYERAVTASVGNMPRARFFASEAPLAETRPYCAPLVESCAEIRAWCRARAVQFVLVVLPRSYQYSARESPRNWERERYTVLGPYACAPFDLFRELSAQVDYPIVPLLEAFQQTTVFPTCFRDDPHWNEDGHGVAARALARALEPILATH